VNPIKPPPIHRFTCRRCGLSFTCEKPTAVDSSWNRYALHTHGCKGRGAEGYDHDAIAVDFFSPVSAQPAWSPYPMTARRKTQASRRTS